eukprot:TRINITY_DN441_c0_g1_i2.p1 TRINITY_DN441_c0_g1~~TRINITY_DN441_c0_g1_i2.p1  ORF type:complete len:128 (+),score=22.04 TRINITY_DN441_c0_g1_i2:31-384(+)
MSNNVTKPTLVYVNAAGRAEVPRLILELAGADYEWNALDWHAKKEEHLATGHFGFGQIPILQTPELGDLPQSQAITRFLANKYGYAGSNPVEAAHIDAINEGVTDIINSVVQILFRV